MFIVYLVPPTLLFIHLFRIIVTLGLTNSLLSLTWSTPRSRCRSVLGYSWASLQVDSAGDRGGGPRRRLPPIRRVPARGAATGAARHHLRDRVQLHITRSESPTLGVGVRSALILGDVFFCQPLLAPALIIAIPVGVAYNLFLDRLVQGFTAGAVKGYAGDHTASTPSTLAWVEATEPP